jgi:hypothetical protein
MPTACALNCAAILLAIGLCRDASAQVGNSTAACQTETLEGRVVQGQSFAARVHGGLVFRLESETAGKGPQGWTIRVTPEARPDVDYSWVATPPYRFWNPRYLDTTYGVSAAEALARTPRDFAFVASLREYDTASKALDVLLWPYMYSRDEVDAADKQLASVTTFAGTLSVVDGAVKLPDADHPGGMIEWLAFRVQLCVPAAGSRAREDEGWGSR